MSLRIALSVLMLAMIALAQPLFAQEAKVATAEAPANHAECGHAATGAFYVDKELLGKFQSAKTELDTIRTQQFRSASSALSNSEKLDAAQSKFDELQSQVDAAKVLVEPFDVFQRRETVSFDLGESRRVVITADDVLLRGWNGKNIKCVIEKRVLGTKEPNESEFDAIAVNHELRQADDVVGASDEVRQEQEREFLASDRGKKMDDPGRRFRQKLLNENKEHYSVYRSMQGRKVNTLTVAGLTGQEGNRHLSGRIKSSGGGGSLSGYWRRSAKVTIYVPPCETVAVRGCMVAVDIKSVKANLVLTTDGSQDRSYGKDFSVVDIDGSVTIRQAPIRTIAGITGDLKIVQTDEVTNTSTSHGNGSRTTVSPPPDPMEISGVDGDMTGRFVRADLSLRKIGGAVDVLNEYGNTKWFVDEKVDEVSHRIVSHSGVIRLTGMAVAKRDADPRELVGTAVYAFTQSGAVKVGGLRQQLESKSYSTAGRGWQGFQTPGEPFSFAAAGRPASAWKNEDRKAGLDLVSNAGVVIVEAVQ